MTVASGNWTDTAVERTTRTRRSTGSGFTWMDGKRENVLDARDGTGYQFVQTRGLVVIDSPIGLVACLPMGMAQVSSVVITAEVGQTLHKGEELGYFQFGGSDFVMVFERTSNVQLISQPHIHYNQGSWIGNAYPYAMK